MPIHPDFSYFRYMNAFVHTLLLADDDSDDCIFFKDALEDLPVSVNLITVNDGVELMRTLSSNTQQLPDILFLDLNMPRKTGFECLSEIKENKQLKHLPIIILSTSLDMKVVSSLHDMGAHYYIRKPGEFGQLKKLIHEAILITTQKNPEQPAKENFILGP